MALISLSCIMHRFTASRYLTQLYVQSRRPRYSLSGPRHRKKSTTKKKPSPPPPTPPPGPPHPKKKKKKKKRAADVNIRGK